MDSQIDYRKLRESREDKDLKQKELAAKLYITPSSYSRIERGERGLRVEQLKVIAEVLEEDISEFLKEKKKDSIGSHPRDYDLQKEITILDSVLSMISVEVEQDLFSVLAFYNGLYPWYPLSFDQYLIDQNVNPTTAVFAIKEELYYCEPIGTYPEFCKACDERGIQHHVDNEEWLNEFVRKKENYDLVYGYLSFPEY